MSRHVLALVWLLHGCGTDELTQPVTAGSGGSAVAPGTGGSGGAPATWSLTPPAEMPCGDGLQVDAPWPAARRCNSRTSRSPFVGPPTAAVKWTRDIHASWVAVGADETLYVATDEGLSALDGAGVAKWSSSVGSVESPPTILRDGSVMVIAATKEGFFLHVVSPSGDDLWSRSGFYRGVLTVADDGTTYAPLRADAVAVVLADRSIPTIIPIEDYVGLALLPSGDLIGSPETEPPISYAGLPTEPVGRLQCRTPFGDWKWMAHVRCERLLVDGDGVTYCADQGSTHAVDASGQLLWTREGQLVAVTHAGTLVALVSKEVRSYRRDGTVAWRTPIDADSVFDAMVDGEDSVYVTTSKGIVAVTANGDIRWTMAGRALALGRDRTLYAQTPLGLTAVGP